MKPTSLIASIVILSSLCATSALAMKIVNKKVVFENYADLEECTGKRPVPECLAALDTWLKAHPGDSGDAAKLVRKNTNAQNAVPYFKLAFANKKADCSETDALEAAQAAFDGPPGKLVDDAKELAFKTCWNDWKEDLNNQTASNNAYYNKNVCPELKKKNGLNDTSKKACH